LKEFYKSDQSSSSEEDSVDELGEPDQDQEGEKKKGAPRIPLKWTRVFKVSRNISEEIEIFNLE
jgi:hypothetical protein